MRILNASELDVAAQLLREGQLVAIPTETVYGLGANALDPEAVRNIYLAKGRPSDNPLIIHVPGREEALRYTRDVPETALMLMERFWPGPLTIVLKRNERIPDCITAGMETVAVRCPRTPVTLELLRMLDFPVAAPSANTSGRPSTTTVAHVVEDLEGRIPAVLDGGDCEYGLESTIIDLSEEVPALLRPGAVTLEELREVLGEVRVDPAVTRLLRPEEKPKAPGMKYRHYAPKAPLTMVRGEPDRSAAWILERIREEAADAAGADSADTAGAMDAAGAAAPETIGVLCFDEYLETFAAEPGVTAESYGSCLDRKEQGHELFDRLRGFDHASVRRIYAQCLDDDGIGLAIVNRLSKAAGFDIKNV